MQPVEPQLLHIPLFKIYSIEGLIDLTSYYIFLQNLFKKSKIAIIILCENCNIK